MPPELLWAAAQTPASDNVVDDWLAGAVPTAPMPRQRW
jgi:hypothetical protein